MPLNPIATHEHHSMLISLYEIIIEECFPLGMEKFTMTMCKESITRHLITSALENKIFKVIRKLLNR